MDDLVNGFTGFANRKAGDGPRYAEPTAAERATRKETKKFNPDTLKLTPGQDRRWAWVDVDLEAIKHNVTMLKRHVDRRMLLADVSANAFGHGAAEVAKAALQAGANYLGVSTVDEGIQLREALVNAPILLLTQPPASAIPLLLAYMIEPSVCTPEFAIAYGETADEYGVRAPYHLVVNTGMNDVGVRWDEAVELLRQIEFHRALKLKGTYTNLATTRAAEPEGLDMMMQRQRFEECLAQIQAAGMNPGIVHATDSAGAIRLPDTWYDMVRAGTALYGLHACNDTFTMIDLVPAMSVKARIVDAKVPPMGDFVGRGAKHRCTGNSTICTIPIGFADGLPKALSGNMDVLYAGQRVAQVGEISADRCMFECSLRARLHQQRLNPQVGEEVVLVGKQGSVEITLDELAQRARVENYEMATMLGSMRLAHVYTQSGVARHGVALGVASR